MDTFEGLKISMEEELKIFTDEFQSHTSKFLRRLSKEFETRSAEFISVQNERFSETLAKLKQDLKKETSQLRRDVEADRKALEDEKASMAQLNRLQSNKVKLDVGGFYFSTSIDTLRRDPHSLLASMFSGRYKMTTEDGRVFIDRNGEYFSYILDFLRDGSIILPTNTDLRDQILKEAAYYRVRLHPPAGAGEKPSLYSFSWEHQPTLENRDPINLPNLSMVWSRSPQTEITDDGRTVTAVVGHTSVTCLVSEGNGKGKVRWEVKINNLVSDIGIGVAEKGTPQNKMLGITDSEDHFGMCYHSSGNLFFQGKHIEYGEEFKAGDVISIWLDFDRREISFSKNGHDFGVAVDGSDLSNISTPLYLAASLFGRGSSISLIYAP